MTYLIDGLKLFLFSPLILTGLFIVNGTSSLTNSRFFKRKYNNYPPFRRHMVLVEELKAVLGDNNKDLKVLDVGCGPGHLLGRLSTTSDITFAELHGTDFKPVEEVKTLYNAFANNYNKNSKTKDLPSTLDFQYTQSDLEREGLVAYNDSYFDVIFCSDVLEHLGNTEFILREIKRCLKPGGVFICSVPNPANFFDRVYFMFTGNSNRFPLEDDTLKYHHVSYFNVPILRNYFRRVGFNPIKNRGDIVYMMPVISRFDVSGLFFSHSIVSVCRS